LGEQLIHGHAESLRAVFIHLDRELARIGAAAGVLTPPTGGAGVGMIQQVAPDRMQVLDSLDWSLRESQRELGAIHVPTPARVSQAPSCDRSDASNPVVFRLVTLLSRGSSLT